MGMVPDHDRIRSLTRRHVALIVCSKVDLVLVARVNLSAINVHMQVKVSFTTNARPACTGANVIINDVPELIKLLNSQRVIKNWGYYRTRHLAHSEHCQFSAGQ